jgi:hypothetical protein
MQVSLGTILIDALRVLTFRRPSPAIATAWPSYLAFGLLCTLIVGVGRYWDNPRAEVWQHAGLGSIAYVLSLALVLWLIALPLKPERWSYRNVLIFVTLTSPPALLYAIPVEQFMSLAGAQRANAWFLLIVAAWRVALLFWFLSTFAKLSMGRIVVAALLPLVLIVNVLAAFNLERVIFELMAGIREADRTGNDSAYGIVLLLALIAQLAALPLLLLYLWQVYRAQRPA